MARHAGQRDAMVTRIVHRVMYEGTDTPVRIAMAVGAITLRAHVSSDDASGDHTVMAGGAVTNQLRVIQLRWLPGQCAMAGAAVLTGGHVIERLANAMHRVMTALASRGDASMIKMCRQPGVGGVAGLATRAADQTILGSTLSVQDIFDFLACWFGGCP